MARIGVSAVALGLILSLAVPAVAEEATGVADRKAAFEQRLTQSMREGMLMRHEADVLRRKFADLQKLEGRYRASPPGLTNAERRSLDRQYKALADKAQMMDRKGAVQGHPVR